MRCFCAGSQSDRTINYAQRCGMFYNKVQINCYTAGGCLISDPPRRDEEAFMREVCAVSCNSFGLIST